MLRGRKLRAVKNYRTRVTPAASHANVQKRRPKDLHPSAFIFGGGENRTLVLDNFQVLASTCIVSWIYKEVVTARHHISLLLSG